MGKSGCVHLFILIWTVLGCLIIESNANRGGRSRNANDQPDESKKSIECYDCNSEYDPNCGEIFEPSTLGTVNCSLRSTPEHLNQTLTPIICRKLVMKIYGKIRVYRGCGYLESKYDDKACVKRSGTHDVQVFHCSCTKSFCNAGHNINPSLPLAAITLVISTLITSRKLVA